MVFVQIFLLILCTSVFAQQSTQYRFKQIYSGNTLPNLNVHKILQDKRGFLWFCSEEGLNKYDGYNFTIYKKEPHNNRSLSDDFIYSACEDTGGILWVATNDGGLNKFDPVTNESVKFLHDPYNNKSINSNLLTSILEDQSGNLWIGTSDMGLDRFDKKTNRFYHYLHDPKNEESISSDDISSLFEDKYGDIWIGTREGGLNKYNKKTDSFISYKFKNNSSSSISSNTVLSFFETRNSSDPVLWVGTLNGLNSFNRITGKFTNYLKNSESSFNTMDYGKNTITSILEIQKGVLWLATFEGIVEFRTVSGKYNRIVNIPANSNSLPGNRIMTLFEDRGGVIWVSILEKGIVKYNRGSKAFRFFKPEPKFANSLSNGPIRAIEEDSYGNLWLGTLGSGIDIMDPGYQNIRHLRFSLLRKGGLSSNEISSIYRDRSGNMWIGSWTSGLNFLDSSQLKAEHDGKVIPELLKFKSYKADPENPLSLHNNIVQAIYDLNIDKKDIMLIGTGQGLDLFDKRKQSFIHILHDPNDPNSISDNRIQSKCIIQDRKNNLWIGTWNGLNKIKASELLSSLNSNKMPAFVHYFNDPSNVNSLSDNRIISMHEDNDGTIWVGTYGGGLNKLKYYIDKNTKKENVNIKSYSVKDGLPSDVVFGILEDKANYLWLSTNNGLSRFDKKNETFINYTTEDGLQSTQFYWGAFCKRKNGELIFGGVNGFYAFAPNEIVKDTFHAPVQITTFKVADQSGEMTSDVYGKNEISLPYDNNSFSFEFSSLDFLSPERNQYAYMLEGFDEKWIKSGNRRYASYTNVNPGEYRFRVRGTNSNGQWNKDEAIIKIRVVPPFWMTLWFKILSAILVAAITVFIYKRRILKIQRRNQQLIREIEDRRKVEEQLIRAKESAERSEQLRSEFLAQMSHEIRTPVNSILSFTSLLKAELEGTLPEDLKPSFSIIESGGRRLIRTIDLILNMSAIQAGVFETKPVKFDIVKDALAPLVGEFTSSAKTKNLELKLQIKTDQTALVADLYTITQIFANLIDNAIKYTKAGSITVTVEKPERGNIIVMVKDTGIGIAKEFIPYLFDAFTQEETGYSRRFEGTGLGLSLVKKFAEMNDSEIMVTSEKGKGTVFAVKFPLT